MSRLPRIGLFATALSFAGIGIAHAALPPGISGSWYDPSKSGQGFSIDVLSRDRALVSWSATDLDGHPFNLYTEARIEGESMIGRALAPRGLRFGAWDRNDLEAPDWGEIRIDFSDCDNAVLSWTPDGVAGVGFPAGSMSLRRLTALAGVRCDFGRPSSPPVLVATASVKIFDGSFPLDPYDQNRYAAIDPEGRLWSMTGLNAASGATLPRIALRDFAGWAPNPQMIVVGEPLAPDDATLVLDVRRQLLPFRSTLATGSFDFATGRGEATPTGAPTDFSALKVLSPSTFTSAGLVRTANRSLDFAGSYRTILAGATTDYAARIDVGNDGAICVRFAQDPIAPCEYRGRLELAFTGAPFVDFVIEGGTGPSGERYRGRGWLQSYWLHPSRVELVLIGRSQDQGAWGIVGARQ